MKMIRTQVLAALALVWAGGAHAGTVVVGNPGAAPMSKDQITDVFVGKNLLFTPVDLPEASAQRSAFYSKVTGRDPSQVKATWSRIVFSGKANPPKELPDAAAVKKAVAADAKTLGYIDSGAVDGTVKVLLTVD